jgi:hypothetical protein
MCSERKTWRARVVAAAMTLALVLACTLSAYEHAAGHHHAASHAAQGGLAHNSDSPDADGGPECLHAGHVHGDGATGESGGGTDSCNFMCNGGYAILAAAAVMEHALSAAPATELRVLLDCAEPSTLERPPRASIPA